LALNVITVELLFQEAPYRVGITLPLVGRGFVVVATSQIPIACRTRSPSANGGLRLVSNANSPIRRDVGGTRWTLEDGSIRKAKSKSQTPSREPSSEKDSRG
jgi:hypothetical protein